METIALDMNATHRNSLSLVIRSETISIGFNVNNIEF